MLAAAGLGRRRAAHPVAGAPAGAGRGRCGSRCSSAAVTQLALAALLTLPAVLVAAFLLGAAGQVVKLCADAAVQSEVGDEVRGRVFALYDAVFNVCYVLAVAVAALLSPARRASPRGCSPATAGSTCSACWPTTAAAPRRARR